MNKHRYVLDSTALISCYPEIFNEPPKIDKKRVSIIQQAIQYDDDVILIIPSIVFVEIYDKWFRGRRLQDEEFREKFKAEIYRPIQAAPNIEIREFDQEVLERFLTLDDPNINFDNHDRIILATASVLEADLITSDQKMKRYNRQYNVVPTILT